MSYRWGLLIFSFAYISFLTADSITDLNAIETCILNTVKKFIPLRIGLGEARCF